MPAARQVTDAMRDEMIARYAKGQTIASIYKAMQISPNIVSRTLVGAGVPLEKNRARALTPRQIHEALAQYEQGESMETIAQNFGCSLEPIKRIIGHARAQGLLVRIPSGELVKRARQDAELIIADYFDGLSSHALHKKYGHHYPYIRTILREAGIDMRDDRNRQGPDSPLYAGGRQKTLEGYMKIWLPVDSPFASMRGKRGHVLEHRFVMAQHLNRSLFPYETVHHRNGDKEDNRIENLELWEGSHGSGQRAQEAPAPHCPTCTCKSVLLAE